jgi:hypothetical protein
METEENKIQEIITWLEKERAKKEVVRILLVFVLMILNTIGTASSEKIISQVCGIMAVNFLITFLFCFLSIGLTDTEK